MTTMKEWFKNQTASNVMTREVACLTMSDRVADAVNLLLREQISGAPVVDERGICVGVLSATDIVTFAEHNTVPANRPPARGMAFDTWNAGMQWWLDVDCIREELEPRLEQSVVNYMTRDVVGVVEDSPLSVVVQQMIDAHLHRILVMDAAGRVVGIISTMDVMAAALRTARQDDRDLAVGACRGKA